MFHSREGTPGMTQADTKGGVTQKYLEGSKGLASQETAVTEDRVNAVVQKLGPMRLWNESEGRQR